MLPYGSTPMIITLGSLSFNLRAMPVKVPPVPEFVSRKQDKNGAQTCSKDDHINFAIRLIQNLFGSAVVVRKGIGWVLVLVQNVGVGDFGVKSLCNTNVRFWGVPRRFSGCTDNGCAEALQHIDLQAEPGEGTARYTLMQITYLLCRHFLRQSDDHLVAFHGGSESQADA